MNKSYRPVVLVIIDGFGVPEQKSISTWEAAKQPNFAELEKFFPFTTVQASGLAVGLPWGESGNSEVGHLTIGSGRIIYNYLPRISSAIKDGSFFKNEGLMKALKHARQNKSSLHFIGLYSTGTVHAYFEHLHALLDFAKENNSPAYLHLFTDGKDAPKKEGAQFYAELEELIKNNYPDIKIASVVGRGFAMDRNGNWDRIQKAYNAFTNGEGNEFSTASEYVGGQYAKDLTDESIEPGAISGEEGRIRDGDAAVIFNFREDSIREITKAFAADDFNYFPREKLDNFLLVTMTEYDKSLPCFDSGICPAAFKSAEVVLPLAEVIANNGMTQLHIAETEKYAHITYFLNGGEETSFPKEDRILVPSPAGGRYDESPEMSADKVAENVLGNLDKYDFIAVNFANADMVGHTGNFEATAKAIEKVDECIGKIVSKILETDGVMIITADHGNAEEKVYKISGEKKSKHSNNPVPFFVIGKDFKRDEELSREGIDQRYKDIAGTLSDAAPTVLELLGLKTPSEMTGKSLLGKIT
ncbi:2,3-bisphosphoglycerate-independent phosphoglycerate mutase [Candidatus Parcubacteria bacterium]|nr:MAG: 2,3-bisphosphoglycerate-independent phosphoglycerate mutase [Candidatus Parcubacteria bacterium]